MEKSGESSTVEKNDDDSDGSTVDTLPTSNLLTNLEVLELLGPRVEQRRRQQEEEETGLRSETAKRKQRKQRKSLRHRDWIEEQVVDYIRQSATMQFQSSQHALPLQIRLRSRKRKLPSHDAAAAKATNESEPSTGLATSTSSLHMNGSMFPNTDDTSKQSLEKEENEKTCFDFTEAEAIQVINFSPRELVDLHLLIDDFPERLSTQQQEECLSLIQQYRVLSAASSVSADTKMLAHEDVLNDEDTNAIAFQNSDHVAIKMEEDILPSYLNDDDPPNGDCFDDWTVPDGKPAAR